MRFKLNNTEIFISFSFLVVLLIIISLKNARFVLYALVFSLLHETGHLFFIKLFSAEVSAFNLTAFGAEIIKRSDLKINYIKEAAICFAGPAVNLIFFTLFTLINKYNYSAVLETISYLNLSVALFNLLPFYCFDGGMILNCFLSLFFGKNSADKILLVFSYITAIPLIILSFMLLIRSRTSFAPCIASIYMMLTLIFKK